MFIGHQKQWQFLKKAVSLGKISHAYLFSGQEKLGKKTLAFEFAKLVNCQEKDSFKRPCNICQSCLSIKKQTHPDLILISPIDNQIQIGQIRDLSWKLSLKPYLAPFKIAILDKVHLMNLEAQSCFLKTLEEPKGKTILILITEYPQLLLPTILSRSNQIKFYPVPLTEIENYLKTKGAKAEEAKKIALLSSGRPGLALDFFLNTEKLENQRKKIEDLMKILNFNLNFRFQYAKDLAGDSNLKEILEIWLRYLRICLMKKIDLSFLQYPLPSSREISLLGLSKLENILRIIQDTIFLIATTNINKRLTLEILMLEL